MWKNDVMSVFKKQQKDFWTYFVISDVLGDHN